MFYELVLTEISMYMTKIRMASHVNYQTKDQNSWINLELNN